MLIAKNSKMKMVKIIDSVEEDTYTCPLCGEKLERKFGLQNQFFSHPKGRGDNCELKLKLMLKNNPNEFEDEELNILKEQYYNKEFSDVKIEMSDYMSNEGYYLTEEQKSIIFAKEDRIKITALAGSSKSTTLFYYSKENPNKKILYLVYNKSMKLEGDIMFKDLHNVTIKTTHGLAYQYVGRFYKNKLTFNYNAIDVMKDLKLNFRYDQEIAVKTYEMFKGYMLSEVATFKELDMYMDAKNRDDIIALCERLWELKKDRYNDIKVEHDFYLKTFQLEKRNLSNTYDIILLDEAQDSNLLMLDILNSSKVVGQVLVGDQFQQLYSWRNACNVLPKFKGKEYKLNTSFRVSQNIANICNMIVGDISDNTIAMKGFNTKQKIVDRIDKSKLYVVLCRTNSSLFGETMSCINSGKKALYYIGGYSGYNFNNILDCYNFSQGSKTKNHLFNKFQNYFQMVDYAEKNEDIELLALIRMVKEYGGAIPELIEKIKSSTTTKREKSDVIFSTIHKSKGSTFPMSVLISDDHFDIEKVYKKKFIEMDKAYFIDKDFYEEMCCVYVSCTRCAGEIELSDKLKNYLIMRYKFNKNNKTKII